MAEWPQEQLEALAPAVDVDEAFAEFRNRRRPPRVWRPLAMVAVVALVVGIGALVWLAGGDDPADSVVADADADAEVDGGADVPQPTPGGPPTPTPSPTTAPTESPTATEPPVGDGVRLEIEVQQLTLVEDGWSVVFRVLGRGYNLDDMLFGVSGSLDVWSGTQWQPVAPFASCLDFWECEGSLNPELLQDIGIGPGTDEYLKLGPLDAGWYRLQKQSTNGLLAGGVFEIPVDTPDPVPPTPPPPTLVPEVGDAPLRIAVTELVQTDGVWVIRFAVEPSDTFGADDAFGVRGWLDYWTGEDWAIWAQVVSCPGALECGPGLHPPGAPLEVQAEGIGPGTQETASLEGAPIEPGWYRLRKESNQGLVAAGLFEIPPDGDQADG